jgi:hypothetical protein
MYHTLLRFRFLVLLLAVLALATSCAPSAAPAAPAGPSIRIDSSASSVQVNDTVRVSIKAVDVANLTAFETHLSFDANVLEVVEVVDGSFVAPDFTVQNIFDNASGTIDYAVAQISRDPAHGSGVLFEIVFRAKAKGDALIRFRGTQAATEGVLLSDPDGMALQVSLVDASVNVK